MAPLDGGMLEAFRTAKQHALSKQRGNLSALVDEIKISAQYNIAHIQLAPDLSRPEKERMAELLNAALGGVYAYVDPNISQLTITINPAMLVRLNRYAADNRVSRQEAILELVELGLASQRR
jgi:hypothetical protein